MCGHRLKPNELFLDTATVKLFRIPGNNAKNLLIYNLLLYKPKYYCHYSFQCINLFFI